MSILLKESRKEDLKKKYAKKFEGGTGLDFILNIPDLVDFNHKYTDWVLKNVNPKSDNFGFEDAVELAKYFDKYSSQFPKKDINQYASLIELESVVNFVRTKNKDKELEKQVEKIYEKENFVVVKPKTEGASCKYGSETRWCTTSKGSGHFERYTAGRQLLYYIINKAKSTNKNYSKVAVHFDNGGNMRYWDTQDSPMSQREIDVFEYAFPEMIDAIKADYKLHAGSMTDKFLNQTFDNYSEISATKNFLNSQYYLSTNFRGFQIIPELGFGHSEGYLSISLDIKGRSKLIDEYQVFIKYKSKNEMEFTVNIRFEGKDEVSKDDFEDLGLESWGIDTKYYFAKSPVETADAVRRRIVASVLDHIVTNPKLTQKIVGTSKVWKPDRVNYGYTFKSKDKGLISKLVKFLDKGSIGTKLDFLTDIGRLEKKVENNKFLYSFPNKNIFEPSTKWRGQFSSFFASAKLAGILNYRKVGKDYLLIKGPNFESFKSGELKAL